MKRIVVTGSTGKAGRAAVRHLQEHGYEVFGVDHVQGTMDYGSFFCADLTDLGQTTEALKGADAVVHLAAIPAPFRFSPFETFRNNILSTYNVFEACSLLGIPRIVWASSETTLGLPFDDEKPAYAPIDEDHPLYPESSYALSKVLSEEMARQFHRRAHGRNAPTIIGLRLSNIMEPHDYAAFPSFQNDPALRKWNLWGYVDADDVAQACRLSLTADIQGAEAFIIAAADTCMNRPGRELMNEVFPGVPVRENLGEFETLLCINKARRLLGYEPAVSWKDQVACPT